MEDSSQLLEFIRKGQESWGIQLDRKASEKISMLEKSMDEKFHELQKNDERIEKRLDAQDMDIREMKHDTAKMAASMAVIETNMTNMMSTIISSNDSIKARMEAHNARHKELDSSIEKVEGKADGNSKKIWYATGAMGAVLYFIDKVIK